MKRALIGYGGHAREVLAQIGENLPCFVDDEYIDRYTLPLSSFNPNECEVLVAIGDSVQRSNIIQRLPKSTKYFTFIHPSVLILGDVVIGEGSFIGANSILTTNIKIGKHAILNRGNQIGHDCVIGDYFSAMPGAIISGDVVVYDCVYIGSNSTIREKLTIHSFAKIGLNTGVVKSIEGPYTYGGVPAKTIK